MRIEKANQSVPSKLPKPSNLKTKEKVLIKTLTFSKETSNDKNPPLKY
jgi:hypothetical protein